MLARQSAYRRQASTEVELGEELTRQRRHDFGDRRWPSAFANLEHFMKDSAPAAGQFHEK